MANRNTTSTSGGGGAFLSLDHRCHNHITHRARDGPRWIGSSADIFAEISIINQTLYTDTSKTLCTPLPVLVHDLCPRLCNVCHHHVVINNDDKNGPTIQSRGQPQIPHALVLKLVDSSLQSHDSRPRTAYERSIKTTSLTNGLVLMTLCNAEIIIITWK